MPVTLDHNWARIQFYVNFGLFMSYTFFVICRTNQIYSDPAATLVDKFYMTFMSAIYISIASSYITAVRMRNTFVPFLRRYIRFLQSGQHSVEQAGQPFATQVVQIG